MQIKTTCQKSYHQKNPQITNDGEDVEKNTVSENVSYTATVENSMAVPQKN